MSNLLLIIVMPR